MASQKKSLILVLITAKLSGSHFDFFRETWSESGISKISLDYHLFQRAPFVSFSKTKIVLQVGYIFFSVQLNSG